MNCRNLRAREGFEGMNPVQQKFDFCPAMCYNFLSKICESTLDIRAQGPDEIIGGLKK